MIKVMLGSLCAKTVAIYLVFAALEFDNMHILSGVFT
jgi:hypothetical protein